VELYQRIEALIEKKLPEYKTDEEAVMLLNERVTEAVRIAKTEMSESGMKKKRKDDHDEGETGLGNGKLFKKDDHKKSSKKKFKRR